MCGDFKDNRRLMLSICEGLNLVLKRWTPEFWKFAKDQKVLKTSALDLGGTRESKSGLNKIGTRAPEILQGWLRLLQTDAMNLGRGPRCINLRENS